MIELNISQLLEWSAKKFQNKLAYSFPAEKVKLDFVNLKKNTDRVSKALLGIGLRKGEHIGIWSTNSSHWVLLALGAAQIGVIFVPINAAYKSEELTYIVRNMDVNYLFVMNQDRGQSCLNRLQCFYENNMLNIGEFPSLRGMYSMSESVLNELKDWNTFMQSAELITDAQLEAAKALVSNRDIYMMQPTSGTTAMPKGVRLYQYGVLYTAECYVQFMHLEENDISCVPLPLFHCFGNVLTLLGGLISGGTNIYLESFSANGMLKTLLEENCTCMVGVPTMFTAMMAQPNFESSKYFIKKTAMGGSYAPPSLSKAITEKFHCPGVVVGYGLSEATSLVTLSDLEDPINNRINTVGKPIPDLEVSLYDEATGNISRTLPQGEIICRGLSIMQGYYNNTEETNKALDTDGWLHTGDLGSFDENGCLRVVGRIKDIIVRGGENISPSQIEALLLELDEIQDVQCVGVPDSVWGEEVAAFVILKEGRQLSEEIIKTYVASHMAKYKVPRYVFFTERFPLNASGKVLKHELNRIAKEAIGEIA